MRGEGESSASVGVGDDSGAASPKNKVKFLCSHGGKVLPRPSDGLLKYVGGETRVISVPRTVSFSELMKKLGAMIDGGDNMVLKYQLVPEDLDTLVSVRNEEDLKHMIDEHDRHHGSGGAPLLRAFLFPSKPVVVENLQQAAAAAAAAAAPASEPYALEQRYIDAINGIVVRTSPRARLGLGLGLGLSPIRALSSSSACSSPKSNSPDGHPTADLVHESSSFSPFHPRLPMMQRVRSSPSITSLSNPHSLTTTIQHHDHHSHLSQSQSQSQCQHPPLAAYASSSSSSSSRSPLQDPQPAGGGGGFGMGRPPPIMSLAKTDMSSRGNNNGLNHYCSSTRPPKGFAYYDDSAAYANNVLVERVNSMPQSPGKSIWE